MVGNKNIGTLWDLVFRVLGSRVWGLAFGLQGCGFKVSTHFRPQIEVLGSGTIAIASGLKFQARYRSQCTQIIFLKLFWLFFHWFSHVFLGFSAGQPGGWKGGRTVGQTDGWTDGRADGQTDGRTDGKTDGRRRSRKEGTAARTEG